MKSILLYASLFIILVRGLSAQTWLPFPYDLDKGVYRLYTDTLENRMYIGGSFTQVDADTIFSIFGYEGVDTFHVSRGLRFRGYFDGAYVHRIVRYGNHLYAGGLFDQAPPSADSMITLARWNGSNWDSVTNPIWGYDASALNVIDDTLFIGGLYNELGGQPCGGVAAYYNGAVVKCYGSFPDPTAHYVSGVIKYNNELYAYGHILDTFGQLAIGRWNSILQTWDRVGGAFYGDLTSSVVDAVVFQGELYVCGDFMQAPNVAGNFIMKWDGSDWYDVSGGLDNYCLDMEVHNGLLYVCGRFQHAGSVPTKHLAVFDGSNWHNMNDLAFDDPNVTSLTFFQNELWVSGNFQKIGADSIPFLAKYNLPLSAYEPKANNSSDFNLFPNPTDGSVTFELFNNKNESVLVKVYDTMGRTCVEKSVPLHSGINRMQLHLSNLMPGIYNLTLERPSQSTSHKFIKE